ncbi:MAG: hypothetical protein RL233_1285, partial [Bacteroidota bacterium]
SSNLIAPFITFVLNYYSINWLQFDFGFMNILVNRKNYKMYTITGCIFMK